MALNITGATVTTSNPVLNLSQTWNNAATTFTGIKLNVTNTASSAASLLMDLQLGGASLLNVREDGLLTVGGAGYAQIDGVSGSVGRELVIGSTVVRAVGLRNNLYVTGSYISQYLTSSFSWSSDARLSVGDLVLWRDAAGILAQRNGTSAQTNRVYNTYTNSSNYEVGVFDWQTTANVLTIGTQNLGTGSARYIKLTSATKAIQYDTTTVASLPSAATAGAGARAFVTDALTPVFGSTVTGGGAVGVPVYSNGTSWYVG